MTAPYARQPQALPRPACTPTAIRAVLAANAGGGILRRYDEDLDAAFEQAREQGDVTPLAARMSLVLMSAVACLRACSTASATVGLAASRSIRLRRCAPSRCRGASCVLTKTGRLEKANG